MAIERSRDVSSISSVARQLHYALEQAGSFETAVEMLRAAAGPDAEPTISRFLELLRQAGDGAPPHGKRHPRPWSTLAWLLRQTPAPEKAVSPMLREYQSHDSFQAATMVTAWADFAGFLTYLGAVVSVLIVVVVLFALLIVPQFRSLYLGFGEDLPTLTALVFGGRGIGLAVVLLTVTGMLGSCYWFVYRLRAGLRRFAPLGGRWERLPLFGPAVRAYDDYLRIAYANLLQAGGVASADALRVAASRVPSGAGRVREIDAGGGPAIPLPAGSELGADLGTAARLGRLGDELKFQRDASADRFLFALARCRRRARVVLTTVVYTLVAICVWSMYLPLFSLGSVI